MDAFSANSLLDATGSYAPAAVFLVLFVESALPVGFVLPGDTLLLAAGLACATGRLPVAGMVAAACAGAVLGAHVGYLLGRAGSRFVQPGPRHQRLARAAERFDRLAKRRGYGPALIAARFIPVARSVAGPLSGLVHTPLPRFTFWQAAGGITWATIGTLVGYFVGRLDPSLERYLPLLLLVAALSFPITAAVGYLFVRLRARRRAARSRDEAAFESDKEHTHR